MLIAAAPNPLAHLVFEFYLWRLLRQHFSHFYLVNSSVELPPHQSLLVTPNHLSWWDGFLMYAVNKMVYQKDFYIMMLQRQLKRYWFFRYLGAFSLEPERWESIPETFLYTKQLLSLPKNLVVMYPQGAIQPFDLRPIKFKRGLQLLLKWHQPPCIVLPMAFKIQYGELKKPDVYFRAGNPLDPKQIISDFSSYEKEFEANLDALNQASFSGQNRIDLFHGKKDER